ncbi:HPr(Ser) kinase/phosphatase [bacterium]|nr:HPr(Ser) kinase/phosphatase [bacterium]
MQDLTVATLFQDTQKKLKLTVVNDKGSFDRLIEEGDLNRPALALTGFVDVFTYKRVQILGNTENAYLSTLTASQRKEALNTLLSFELPCVIVTEDNPPFEELVKMATQRSITVFRTPSNTTRVVHVLSNYLDDTFAPQVTVHGSMADVYGIGVLFTGRSGIGKSEIVLDLVERGHRLVADDVVHIAKKAEGVLIANASDLLRHHMEIRGLGIIDVRSVFGIRSIRLQKRVEVEVQLEEWDDAADYDRIGLDDSTTKILDVEVPLIKLPIFPGKNITVIAEVVALHQLLKIYGHHPAKEFNEKLIEKMHKTPPQEYLDDYLDRDFE